MISLSSSSCWVTEIVIGKFSNAALTINSVEGYKKLGIGVIAKGNFGEGGQEAVMKLISDFKAKLLPKIGQLNFSSKAKLKPSEGGGDFFLGKEGEYYVENILGFSGICIFFGCLPLFLLIKSYSGRCGESLKR